MFLHVKSKTCSHLICDLSTYVIEGRTSVAQITGTWLKEKKKENNKGEDLPHMWLNLCWPPWTVSVKKQGEHDPRPSVFLRELQHCAVCNSRPRHE